MKMLGSTMVVILVLEANEAYKFYMKLLCNMFYMFIVLLAIFFMFKTFLIILIDLPFLVISHVFSKIRIRGRLLKIPER